jgi:hypothetical protein
MSTAKFLGTAPLSFLTLPEAVANWQPFPTEDLIIQGYITRPNHYMLTMGSAIHPSVFASLATTPAYRLPSATQRYIAGRDVIRWGGPDDPHEVDFDRYVFSPFPEKDLAHILKAPKSEPHHLSDVPGLMKIVPDDWKEILEGIRNGEFA